MLSLRIVVDPFAKASFMPARVHSRSMSGRIDSGVTLSAATLAFMSPSFDAEDGPRQPGSSRRRDRQAPGQQDGAPMPDLDVELVSQKLAKSGYLAARELARIEMRE